MIEHARLLYIVLKNLGIDRMRRLTILFRSFISKFYEKLHNNLVKLTISHVIENDQYSRMKFSNHTVITSE